MRHEQRIALARSHSSDAINQGELCFKPVEDPRLSAVTELALRPRFALYRAVLLVLVHPCKRSSTAGLICAIYRMVDRTRGILPSTLHCAISLSMESLDRGLSHRGVRIKFVRLVPFNHVF